MAIGLARTSSEVVAEMLRRVRAELKGGSLDAFKPRNLPRVTRLYLGDRVGRRSYRTLSEAELLATRASEAAFVFGSGGSLRELTADDWSAISRCATISMREFPRQRWVRADYHLIAEVDVVDEYARLIAENPLYAETVFVVQEGMRAERGNELVARRLLPAGARIFRFRRVGRGVDVPPSRTPRKLVHGHNSIFDATNFAIAMGFRRIVLAGADYYDREYFWLPPGETRTYERAGLSAADRWKGFGAIASMMGRWRSLLEEDGIRLYVYNPRSLLTEVLPVFRF